MLWLCLASNMQLASRLAAMRGWFGVQCILWPPGPSIREPFWFHVFGILLPYIEVAVQWACAMILSVHTRARIHHPLIQEASNLSWGQTNAVSTSLYLFVHHRSADDSHVLSHQPMAASEDAALPVANETTPLNNNNNNNNYYYYSYNNPTAATFIPSHHIVSYVTTTFMLFVPLALVLLFTYFPSPNLDWGGALWQGYVRLVVHFVYVAISLLASLYAAYVQIADALQTPPGPRPPPGLSLLSLALQAVVLLALGVLQLRVVRPDPAYVPPPPPQDPIDQPPQTPLHLLWTWFVIEGNIGVNYLILGVAHAVAFLTRVR